MLLTENSFKTFGVPIALLNNSATVSLKDIEVSFAIDLAT